jgi:N4-gp56 family major capsid protein
MAGHGATDFAGQRLRQKVVWARDTWSAARDQMFVKRFMGKSDTSMIQRITELTPSERGERVLMQLVADLVEDGTIGDDDRESEFEEIMSYAQEITIDLFAHQVISKGKLSDQKSVLNFAEHASSKLAYWLADRVDQMALLALAGVSFAYRNNGAPRGPRSKLKNLAFAQDVKPLTPKRHLMWNGTSLIGSDTTQITSNYLPNYRMVVDAMTYMQDHYIKGLRKDGKEYFVFLMKPSAFGALKKDPEFQRAIIQGMPRSKDSPWFTGSTAVTVDGAVFHIDRRVYNTAGAANGAKWGLNGLINGTRTQVCGAQALGFADLGQSWEKKKFNFNKRTGFSIDKMLGMLVPQFFSIHDNSNETFGTVGIDHFLPAV